MDDLIGEILLRVPPDEPTRLIRATLVCKAWRRILFDPVFLRRYREFHRTPPLLGVIWFDNPQSRIVSTTTASPFSISDRPGDYWWTLDCRHGRVLLYSIDTHRGLPFLVWDPITGDQKRFLKPKSRNFHSFSAAVLCAADSCSRLDCHGGPFRVVFACTDKDDVSWVSEYSPDTGVWSASTTIDCRASHKVGPHCFVDLSASLFTGDAVYFSLNGGNAILKHDLGGRDLSVIDTPDEYRTSIVMTAEDGGLGIAGEKDYNLYLWSWKASAKGIAGWVQLKVIDLKTLLPNPEKVLPNVICFAEGTDTIFLGTNNSIFTLKLKSGQVRKVGPRLSFGPVIPYMSFYAPDLVGARLLPR